MNAQIEWTTAKGATINLTHTTTAGLDADASMAKRVNWLNVTVGGRPAGEPKLIDHPKAGPALRCERGVVPIPAELQTQVAEMVATYRAMVKADLAPAANEAEMVSYEAAKARVDRAMSV